MHFYLNPVLDKLMFGLPMPRLKFHNNFGFQLKEKCYFPTGFLPKVIYVFIKLFTLDVYWQYAGHSILSVIFIVIVLILDGSLDHGVYVWRKSGFIEGKSKWNHHYCKKCLKNIKIPVSVTNKRTTYSMLPFFISTMSICFAHSRE